jgi:hypothetical protein
VRASEVDESAMQEVPTFVYKEVVTCMYVNTLFF